MAPLKLPRLEKPLDDIEGPRGRLLEDVVTEDLVLGSETPMSDEETDTG